MLKKSLLSACIAASVLLTACHDDDDQHSNTSPTPTTTYSNMRNKSNRLEELFVKMVEKNLAGANQ